ncbi:MAG TPA: pectin acetylesterase-family hydrolase [Gemmatimonadaceae bacterium]|nr:pectin acetylesterase-family hydrolase [Gemmatimonadaceae bacterium]
MPARFSAFVRTRTTRTTRTGRLTGWLAAIALIACSPSGATEPQTDSIEDLSPGWHRIAGGPGTGCAFDTPFSFYVRPGDPRKLLVHLQAGGACWNGETCDPLLLPTFDPVIDTTDHPSRAAGILSLHLLANPVHDFSIIVVPYCTGDLHLGSRAVTYRSPGAQLIPARDFTVKHWGARNVESVLRWAYRHFAQPEIIFVNGSSAGAIASPVYAAELAEEYPSARVVQLGDGAGGYRVPGLGTLMGAAGALDVLRGMSAFQSIDSAAFTFEDLYVLASRARSNLSLAQYNSANDATQLFFLHALGVPSASLTPLLAANLAELHADVPGFRSYTAPGVTHTILFRSSFYTLAVDGVTARDWVAALLDGTSVPDIGSSLLGGN